MGTIFPLKGKFVRTICYFCKLIHKMRKKLVITLATLLAAALSLQAQGDRTRRLISQGDSLCRAYLFDDAIDKYLQAVDLGVDEKTHSELEKKVQEANNAILMMDFCADPHVVARQRFSRKDFFQYYPLKAQSWHAAPNPLDSLDGFPTYFPKGDKSVVYSAMDLAGTRSLFTIRDADTLWTAPRLMGESLTTLGSEIFPMLSPDGKTLYFASDGLYGMGGFDLYTSTWDPETRSWGEPENMGIPFNSPGDDFLLVDTEDGKYTIFASNRDCSKDSVYVYVLDYDHSRDRKVIRDHKDLKRIVTLDPDYDPTRIDHGAFTEEAQESEATRLYREKNNEARALRDSISRHQGDEDPARLEELREKLRQVNAEVNMAAEAFLNEGVVSGEHEDKEVVGAGLSYTFAKNGMGPRIRIKMAKGKKQSSIKIMPIGRMAKDMTLPSGLIYQIQLRQATRRLGIEDLLGITGVYERISPNLRIVYSVGLFETYDDALAELNVVKKQGFPDAQIVAMRDGKQIPLSEARAEEK